MLGLKDALAGDVMLNWSDATSIRNWDGITVAGDPRRVTKIILGYRRMTGMVPPELAQLGALEIINLTDNYLTGSIPSELGGSSNLRELNLGVNRIRGHLPSELGQLTNLEQLDLGQNDLTGPIPTELGSLTKLKIFIVGSNYMTGNIPQELTSWTDIQAFVVDSNDFTGCVPTELRAPQNRLGDLSFCDDIPDLWSTRQTFEGGVELGVTFIERTPRYPTQRVAYFGKPSGCPYPVDEFIGVMDCPGQEGLQRTPSPGQTVQLTAHVWNFGDEPSPAFRYQWRIDNVVTEESEHEGLAAGERALFEFQYTWPEESEYPLVTFVADPSDAIRELIEDNNQVDDWIKGPTIGIYFTPTSYASLKLSNEAGRTVQSPEHWVRSQTEELNRLFELAGVKERVRLEQLYITEDRYISPDIRWTLDGWWGIRHGGVYTPEGYRDRPEFDYGLLHEWLHQLGINDPYTMIIGTRDMVIPDANRPGEFAGCGHPYERNDYDYFTFPDQVNDLMTYVLPRVGVHTAGALNVNFRTRKGFFGEYLYDTAELTMVKIVDQQGVSVAHATLNFYQQEPGGGSGRVIDATAEFTVTTDGNGVAVLPNRGVTGNRTSTGHQLKPNPFGVIDVVGANGVMLIEMVKDQCTNYDWLTIVELNLAYWDGHAGRAEFTKTLQCPLTAGIHDAPETHDGNTEFTFELRFSENPPLSYQTLRNHAFTVTGGEVIKARRLEPPGNGRWEITVRPSSNSDVTVTLPATPDCAAQGAICMEDSGMLSIGLVLTVPGLSTLQSPQENSAATGAPTISGTVQVDETLTVDTTGISDADGLTNATFAYQWLGDDVEISGANGSGYTLVAADEGKAIKVRVSFTDDAGYAEMLTSAATSAVAARPNSAATGGAHHHRHGSGGRDAHGEHDWHIRWRRSDQRDFHPPMAGRRC